MLFAKYFNGLKIEHVQKIPGMLALIIWAWLLYNRPLQDITVYLQLHYIYIYIYITPQIPILV